MKRKLVYHGSLRTRKIYDGSIRRPRTGADDNKSVGFRIEEPKQALSLLVSIGRYLAWNTLRRLGGSGDAPLLITSYKYNKGPAGHATTLTSTVKQ
jgi:hypothetical protein